MPGGLDTGESKIVAMNPWGSPLTLTAESLTADKAATVTGIQGTAVPSDGSVTRSVTTSSPSTIIITSDATAVARRSFGANGDQGGTGGAAPGADWVVLPAVTETPPFEPRLLVANPGDQPAEVTLTLIPEAGIDVAHPTDTLTVRPGTTGFAELPQAAPHAAVVVHSTQPVVPAFAAYSNDRGGYAVSVGVPWSGDSGTP